MSAAAVVLLLIIALAVSSRFRRIVKDCLWLPVLLLLLPMLLILRVVEKWTAPRPYDWEGYRK